MKTKVTYQDPDVARRRALGRAFFELRRAEREREERTEREPKAKARAKAAKR